MATDTILPLSLSYRDAKGWVGRVHTFVAGDSTSLTNLADINTIIENFKSAVDALSNAAFDGASQVFNRPTLTFGTNAEYRAEWMKAVMTFSNDRGQLSRFKIPAPKIAIFELDGVTVINDGTSTPVVNFVNAVKNATNASFICNAAGQPFTHFEGGICRLGKQPRRFNGRIKSAHLVAGEGE